MRRIPRVIVPLSIVVCAGAARAQKPPPPPAPAAPSAAASAAPAASAEAEAEAKEHFDKGRKLLVDGAFAAALAEFLESRRLFPSRAATTSAAVCLRKLERYDEALALMEAVLRDFRDLPEEVKTAAQKQILELRDLVGTIEISGAEPGASIIVNGQVKGEFPLLAPLRVPAGSHLVRIYKEGFETLSVRVDVAGQGTATVPARMKRLVQA